MTGGGDWSWGRWSNHYLLEGVRVAICAVEASTGYSRATLAASYSYKGDMYQRRRDSIEARSALPEIRRPGCKTGGFMSGQIGPGTGEYQIQPFSDNWADDVQRLHAEMIAVRDKIKPFYLADPDPVDVALADGVAKEVARYALKENDRHATITAAATAVGDQIEQYASSRKSVAGEYVVTASVIAQQLGGLYLTGTTAIIEQFDKELRSLTERFIAISEGDKPKEIKGYIQSIDPATLELMAQYTLRCGLAGRIIDAGNAFLNFDAQQRAALEIYAHGKAPQGWSQHLPAPVRSIFSESTWTIIEEILRAAAEHGLPAVVPFAAIPVVVARTVLEVRETRVREQRKFQRGDVDELLDLADQMTNATHEAQRLQDSIRAMAQAALAVAVTSLPASSLCQHHLSI